MIVATAGHVDHGKSTLVRLITGTDPDRWDEERRRGLTIDLGFAWMNAPDVDQPSAGGHQLATLGFVDVPGHRHFLSNMLAGCGAVDLALLVVSAREGWMPQTEEHSQILELLGIRRGVVAVTHADIVDADVVDLAIEEVIDRLRGTSLSAAPIIATSAADPASVDALAVALFEQARAAAGDAGVTTERPRLWIDRSFTIDGAGRVVTGTLAGGSLAVGDDVAVVGHEARGQSRVRSAHVYGAPTDVAIADARVGLNLTGLAGVPERGQAVVRAGQWSGGRRWRVALTPVRTIDGRIPPRGGYQVFVGTAHATAQLRYGADEPGPDETHNERGAVATPTLARLHLQASIAPLGIGDRFILRDESNDSTVGGGTILAVDNSDIRYRRADLVDRWRAITGGSGRVRLPLPTDATLALAGVLVGQSGGAMPRSELEQLVGPLPILAAPPPDAGTAVAAPQSFELRLLGDHVVLGAIVESWADSIRTAFSRGRVIPVPDDEIGLLVAADLVERGEADRRGDQLSAKGVAGHDEELRFAFDVIVSAVDAVESKMLTLDELRLATGIGSRPVNDLVRDGRLVMVGAFVTSAAHFEKWAVLVADALHHGPASVAHVREKLGLSRKYVVPLLETLDGRGSTARVGGDRVWISPNP